MHATFKLGGLDCSSCSLAIENVLDHKNGVRSCDVNDREQTLAVEYDEQQVTSEQIRQAVEEAGFTAEILRA